MANWTQQEMDELIAKMTKKAMTDAAFRKEVLADATKALEQLAGKPLPEGASVKCVERDPNYQNTLVLPDFVDAEKLDDGALSNVAGGVGFGFNLFPKDKMCFGFSCLHGVTNPLVGDTPLVSGKQEE
jgi:hypothetical protein